MSINKGGAFNMNIIYTQASDQLVGPHSDTTLDEGAFGISDASRNILYLTSRLPIPPLVKGDTLRNFYIIKELASRGHKITLVSFYRKNEINHPNLGILKKYCQEIKLI